MKLVITQEDTKNTNFTNVSDCALARAAKRAGITQNPIVDTTEIADHSFGKNLGKIEPAFYDTDFNDLKSGKIKEFVTEYTPYDKVEQEVE